MDYRLKMMLDVERKEALDHHLNFIVEKTEKYSNMLAESLADQAPSGVQGRDESVEKEDKSEVDGENEDVEYAPEGESDDDEETIPKEEYSVSLIFYIFVFQINLAFKA